MAVALAEGHRVLTSGRRSALALAATLAAGCAAIEPAGVHPFLHSLVPPLVIAHRGGAALRPENTAEAFRQALARGADVLEIDVRAAADGALVVVHDATVDRTTNGSGTVAALTLRELQSLDAGYRWSGDGGQSFPYRGRGLAIPSLEAVLTDFPHARLLIEMKPPAAPLAEPLCRLLTAAHPERVMVASFDARGVERFRRACPHVATGATPREVARFVAARALRLPPPRMPAVAMQLPKRWRGIPVLTPRVVAAAHARRLQVHAWTIDDAGEMQRLLNLGVDGLVTDRPDRLLDLLGRTPSCAGTSD